MKSLEELKTPEDIISFIENTEPFHDANAVEYAVENDIRIHLKSLSELLPTKIDDAVYLHFIKKIVGTAHPNKKSIIF
jgi:hypothetical protein